MAINSDIRDHAYQFFTEEAPELLQILEAGLLTLNQRSTAQVHNLMRAAHSLKGGAASVGLDAIATLAHRLENILKALYSDSLEVDTALENDLLRAYDCLRLPLMEQITTGQFDPEALAIADPIFTQIESRCGDALLQSETYLPSSAELGVDMVTSIFEVDVAQGLDRLAAVLAHPQGYEVAGELRAQIEVFIGFAELLSLPEFKTIAEMAQQALNAHPDRALDITELTLVDLQRCRQAILAGDRAGGLEPSAALTALALDATAAIPSMSDLELNSLAMSTPATNVPTMSAPENWLLDLDRPGTSAPVAADADPDTADQLTVALPQLENLFGVFGGAFTAAEMAIDEDGALEESQPMTESFAIDQDAALEAALLPFAEALDQAIATSDDGVSNGIAGDGLIDYGLVDYGTDGPDAVDYNPLDPAVAAYDVFAHDALESDVVNTSETAFGTTDYHGATADVDAASTEVIDAEWVAAQRSPAPSSTGASSLVPAVRSQPTMLRLSPAAQPSARRQRHESTPFNPVGVPTPPNLTVRVDATRLERMSNLVGELTINRNGLSLQNEQLQGVLRELLKRFARFEDMVSHLRESLDQMLV